MKKFFSRKKGYSCDDVMQVLQSYLDGETDVETARKVAAHLDDCQDCDLESSVYAGIKASLATRAEPVDAAVMDTLRDFSNRVVSGEIE